MRSSHLLSILATLALAALLAGPAAASAAYDESTSLQITPGHTGFASGGSLDRPPLRARWTRTVGTSTSFPIIAGGRVFVVAYDAQRQGGTLYALDAASGATLWMRAVPGGGQIAYDAGRVFVAEDAGSVVAVDAASGATRWTRNLPESFMLQIPVAADGTVYVDSAWSGGGLYALDASTGATRWFSAFYNEGGPAVDGSFVYVSDDYEGRTAAFSRADGTLAWNGTKECFVGSGRTVADGARVIAPYGGGCGAVVDAASGTALDTFSSNSAAAVAGEVAVVRNGAVLQARGLTSGVIGWEFTGDGKLNSAPVIVNETVYVGSSTGMLFAVDLRTGALVWSGSVATGASAGSAGMAAGGGLLVVPAGGTLSAMESVQAARPGLDLRIASGPDGPTASDDATLTFGSGSPLALEVCRLDGGAWLPCLGSVAYAGLADGPHTFEVQTREPDGSVIALAVRGWSVDTRAPVARIAQGPSGLTTNRWASFGVAADDANAQLECRLDEGAWSACGRSAWDTVEYGNLADGPHRFDVRAHDALGNRQAGVTSRGWTVDATAPRVTIDAGPQGATAQTSATFEFSADEPATFFCSMDGAPLAACASPFRMSGVGAGTHSLVVKAVDAAGNLSYPGAQRTWTVGDPAPDTTPPDTWFTAAPPLVTAATSASFSFASGEYGGFECRLDGAPWAGCYPPAGVTGLADGPHAYDVRAIDVAGNVDPSPASWRWTVDTRPPQTRAALAAGSGPQAGYRFQFDADEDATFECVLDSAAWTPCASGVAYGAVGAGDHEFRVRATDTAGNRLPQGTAVAFSVAAEEETPPPAGDTTPPVPTPPADTASATPPPAAAPPAVLPAPPPAPVPGTPAARAATVATTPQITIEPAECARMLAADGAALLRSTTRKALRRGPKLRLYAFRPGRSALTITTRRDGRTITVARAESRFAAPGVRTVRLQITAAGRRALAGRTRLTLRVRATVRPDHMRLAAATRVARI